MSSTNQKRVRPSVSTTSSSSSDVWKPTIVHAPEPYAVVSHRVLIAQRSHQRSTRMGTETSDVTTSQRLTPRSSSFFAALDTIVDGTTLASISARLIVGMSKLG